LSNQHRVHSEVASHAPTFSTTQKQRQDRSSTYLGLVLFDRDGSDSAVADEPRPCLASVSTELASFVGRREVEGVGCTVMVVVTITSLLKL